MKKALAVASLLGGVVLAAGYYLAQFRPVIVPVPVEQVDAASQKSGLSDCFWVGVSTPADPLVVYPDTGASYWITQFNLPKGATLELSGAYPHARHFSFNAYDDQSQPVDRLNDFMIAPAAGATNPFVIGARRDAPERDYKIRIVEAEVKAGMPIGDIDKDRPANTLFVPADKRPASIWMRIYVPDHGLAVNAGAPLPKPVMRLADGSTVEGPALCRQIVVKEGAVQWATLRRSANLALMNLASKTSPYHPAQPVPKWFPFFNPTYVLAPNVFGTDLEWITSLLSTTQKGGFYTTLDNRYIATMIDRRFGDVLVIKGKAPTTPNTLSGAAVMQPGQLRYWSFCKYRSLHDPEVDGCLYDQQVPVDAAGNFTIVMSTPENRPTNATPANGVAWMDWGSAGDGMGNPAGGMLIYRQMMPAADFKNSIFEIHSLGEMDAAMAAYFPVASYMSRVEFEQKGG
jgi:hypothetical protein